MPVKTIVAKALIARTFIYLFALMLLLSATPGAYAGPTVITAFKQAVAEASAQDRDLAEHYRKTDYAPIWTGPGDDSRLRRAALMQAIAQAPAHGLPAERYDAKGLLAQMQDARSPRDLGKLEVALSETFMRLSRDMQTGVIKPASIDEGIKRVVPLRDRKTYLPALMAGSPSAYFRALPPQTLEYTRLMRAKLDMEHVIETGGWGELVAAEKLAPGDSGSGVVGLRNRLVAMDYLAPSARVTYDAAMQAAVQEFQISHGLEPDGIAGPGTIEEINVSADMRLRSIIVAMERERWLNKERGDRHVLVNIADFSAKIVDFDRVTFETRAVVGNRALDRRTPEFSDVMEHMVINPSWYVPRSIVTKEYLPKLQQNPNAHGYIEITDSRGRRIDRNAVDFSQFSARSFPFAMRQPPGQSNALGLVKFMFPNPYNIYLHDTPQKKLFAHEVRAYSHGCIRLAQPFDFAYALLARQTDDPVGLFKSVLNTGRESRVDLETPVPVHLIYRTAFTTAKGHVQFRRDVYGRDAKIWDALVQAGVAQPGVQG